LQGRGLRWNREEALRHPEGMLLPLGNMWGSLEFLGAAKSILVQGVLTQVHVHDEWPCGARRGHPGKIQNTDCKLEPGLSLGSFVSKDALGAPRELLGSLGH